MYSETAEFIREALRALKPDWHPERIQAFEFLSGGYSNDNYRFAYEGDQYVVRLPSRVRSFIDRKLERAFYQQHQGPFAIPELIALDEITGNLITRYVPGALLPDADRYYDPYALSRDYLAAGDAPISIRKLADGPWQPEQTVTCHNDLNPWNVIQSSSERWVTLDWEWLGLNDPLFDLVTLHQGMGLADESLQSLVELWQEAPINQDRLEACLIAFWLREFAWAWAERHHGNTRQEIEEQIAVSKDKLAALLS